MHHLVAIERIQFTDAPEKVTITPLTIYGQTGTAGRGITSIGYEYKVTSNDAKPLAADSGWAAAMPVTAETNRWLWFKETTKYTDNTQDTVIGLQVVHRQTGATL
jgi:hypothetical protein